MTKADHWNSYRFPYPSETDNDSLSELSENDETIQDINSEIELALIKEKALGHQIVFLEQQIETDDYQITFRRLRCNDITSRIEQFASEIQTNERKRTLLLKNNEAFENQIQENFWYRQCIAIKKSSFLLSRLIYVVFQQKIENHIASIEKQSWFVQGSKQQKQIKDLSLQSHNYLCPDSANSQHNLLDQQTMINTLEKHKKASQRELYSLKENLESNQRYLANLTTTKSKLLNTDVSLRSIASTPVETTQNTNLFFTQKEHLETSKEQENAHKIVRIHETVITRGLSV